MTKHLRLLFLGILSILLLADINAQVGISIPAVDQYEVIAFDNSVVSKTSGNKKIQFDLVQYGTVQLFLWPAQVVSDHFTLNGAVQPKDASEIQTWQGETADGGAVRLTTATNFTYGFIEYGDETFWIEPAWYYSSSKIQSNEIIIYKQSDVEFGPGRTCGVTEAHIRGEELNEAGKEKRSQVGNCYIVELAIASDYSMFQKYGNSNGVIAHNVGVINNVNGNYSGEFEDDVQFEIVTQFISTCSSCDPWTGNLAADTLLYDFTSWGQGGNFGVSFDVGELWTNRDFTGPTVGLAWVNAVCGSVKYHILQDHDTNADIMRVTTAHEIGHNFSAWHDGNPSPFIMAPYVQNTNNWSANSKDDISAKIASVAGACFSTCSIGNPPVADFESEVTSFCGPMAIRFGDKSTNTPTEWHWIFENGSPSTSTQQNPVVTYEIAGQHSVTLTVSNSLGSDMLSRTGYIDVTLAPSANFSFTVDGNNVEFNVVTDPSASASWTFGDGFNSTALNPSHLYVLDGIYEVELSTTTSCGSNSEIQIIQVSSCVNNLFITGNLNEGAHVAGASIQSDAQINSNQSVYFHAPNFILLENGMQVPLGAEFTITNSDCLD